MVFIDRGARSNAIAEEHHSLNPVVAVCGVRFHFNFLPAGDGERNR
jgi:hypothetical protein